MTEDGVQVEMLDGQKGARLRGELDLSTYDGTADALSPLFEASGDVVLDVSELTFVDSSGIRLFILLHQALGDRGRLVLRGQSDHVARILQIAGLPEIGVRLEPSAG